MTKVAVAMLGARMHYAVPRLLYQSGLLERFYTDSYAGNKPWMEVTLRAVPARLRPRAVQRWLGRKDAVLPRDKVRSFEMLGLWYAWAQYHAEGTEQLEKVYRDAAVKFSQCVLTEGLGHGGILWGFNGASVELFEAAKARGFQCILEQTSNPKPIESQLIQEEFARWADWEAPQSAPRTSGILLERERREWELADRVVAGSQFVASGLSRCGVSPAKIDVVPYGIDLDRFRLKQNRRRSDDNPLRVLFVGRVSLMKGIRYLLQALAALGPNRVEARLIGTVAADSGQLEPFRAVATVMGAVPRSDLPLHYQWADVFCFPSITEGSATVTYEALASGLPVITTPNAGSVVRDGVDGFVVPIRDVSALTDALRHYQQDRALLERHRVAARNARARVGIDRYRNDLERVVSGLSKPSGMGCSAPSVGLG